MGLEEQSMEEKASCSTSTSATAAAPTPQHDDFSLFLHHFLHRSSSSSAPPPSSSAHPHPLFFPPDITHRPPVDSSSAAAAAGAGYLPGSGGPHAPSSSLGASENETDEYDCESEEGLDALLEDIPPKPNPSRNSSKRSRTAEVHNLSEKRRRSRINEKMKALQSLIPNSNKTDKASMLDEAIEYLKQLQLQVQMLSMRNGLTLHPMCLPGVLQSVQIPQMRALFGDETENLHGDMTGSDIPINQEASAQQAIYGSPDQRPTTEPHLTNMFDAGPSFGLEPSVQIHPGAYQLNSASEEVCREEMLRHRQSNVNPPDARLFGGPSRNMYHPKIEFEGGARAAGSLPFASQPSNNIKLSGRDQSQG